MSADIDIAVLDDATLEGVETVDITLTGIAVARDTGDSALDYLPAVFVLRSTGGLNSEKAHIFMESIYTDAISGQVLAEIVQGARGGSVKDSSVALEHLKGVLDQWAAKAAQGSTAVRDGKSLPE